MAAKSPDQTPAMRQYHRFKQQHPGCVLFFRMGDFYEMFHDDAKLAHKVLGVTLTQRTEGVPMAGVPYHAVENYLRRMIEAGHRVAVCDQVEDAAQAKGVVKRDVTRVITPGTLTDESLLEEGRENPLAAVVFLGEGAKGPRGRGAEGEEKVALAWAELSTGAFHVAALAARDLGDELARISPRELLYCETANGEAPPRVAALRESVGCALTPRPAWQCRLDEAVDTLKRQYQVAQLTGFGFESDDPALAPAGMIVHYLLETQCSGEERGRATERPGDQGTGSDAAPPRSSLAHLQPPRRFERHAHLVIDQTSLRSLEVERTLRTASTDGALLGVFRGCATAMGKRLLRHWLCYPLRDRAEIEQRQDAVQTLVDDERLRESLHEALDGVQDVQRITARLAVNRALPRDLVALGRSAQQATQLTDLLADRPTVAHYHEALTELVEPMQALAQCIVEACVDEPPAHLREGGLIRDGYDAQLDEDRVLQRDSSTWLAEYQKQLIEETGVPNLKVGFNKVFGYYIELSAANRDKAPDSWSRKQTLKNAERFITPELKEYEQRALSAESRSIAREQELFRQLCERASRHTPELHAFAQLVAELDVLQCFAQRAVRGRYVRPRIVDEPVLHVEGGRHPVLDELLGDQFVPNDVVLGVGDWGLGIGEEEQGASDGEPQSPNPNPQSPTLALITGPNMAGKSTYIRQAALITLLAHTGSFVPADRATVGVCDRIFTRIGASDELHAGQSTFMVEMTEAANICHHATSRSLVILDEIGRGTSTLDGLSLAWAIADYLAAPENGERGPRTLFATHYHELTQLAEQHASVTNLNVTVREWQDQVVFLHRIVPGATDRSYGIHVAKIAG
ncbi:MAG: DNA mismatch repair protein MutS, partial [Phycisphaeraceae bacterium]